MIYKEYASNPSFNDLLGSRQASIRVLFLNPNYSYNEDFIKLLCRYFLKLSMKNLVSIFARLFEGLWNDYKRKYFSRFI